MSCLATIVLFIILVICFIMGFYFMLIALLSLWGFVMGFVAYIWFREKLEEYRAKKRFKKESKK